MEEDLKKKTKSGLIWSLAEKTLTQGFSFAIGIIMARLLLPEDYGYVVIATAVISIFEALVEGGLANALIQRKDADEEHSSTMFYFMVGVSLVFYFLMIIIAPIVAAIYKMEVLTKVIRVFAITLPIGAVRTFLMALMQKQMKFKLLFVSCFAGTVIGGSVGIWMALSGYQVWALVAYMLINKSIDTFTMVITMRWRPKWVFSVKKLKQLYAFAGYSLAWQLVNQYTNQFIELIFGKLYSSAQLSYYNRGKQYPFLLCNIMNNAIGSALFPVLSRMGDSMEQLKNATRRSIKLVSYIQFPVLFGFAAVAEPLVRVLLTEKWILCVPFLQITCITYSFWPYLTCYSNAIDACGKVKSKFIKELIMTVFKIVVCGGALFISPMAVAIAYMAAWMVDAVMTSVFTQSAIDYKLSEQFKDVFVNYVCAGVMTACVYVVGTFIGNDFIKVGVQILAGIISYVGISVITRNDSFTYLLNMIRKKN